VSNHNSYLDAAPLFAFTGRRMGAIAKKELLKGADTRLLDGLCERHGDRSIES
jgi:1-acyl-sn-glycerol-3-phosphate acyltransferase